MRNAGLLGALLLSVSACDQGETTYRPVPEPPTQSMNERVLAGLPADAVLVGLAIQPDGGVYVLDQRSGLYEVSDQTTRLVFNTSGLGGVTYTDVVALDDDTFALTAENDGFQLDLRTTELDSFFCYLPSPAEQPEPDPGQPAGGSSPGGTTLPVSISQRLQSEGIPVKQRTESVAFNTSSGQIFAQPQTTRLDSGAVAGSELFVFERSGGEPVQVLTLEPSFVAGGMVTLPPDRLLLGAGNGLYELTLSGELSLRLSLADSVSIAGMARAPDGAIWVLDGASKRLLRLEAAF
jgi:hypothetical protein